MSPRRSQPRGRSRTRAPGKKTIKKEVARRRVQTRVPLQAREVQMIRRMKTVLKLPVTKIALAVNRNKTSIYAALSTAWSPGKRGRPQILTKPQVSLLVRVTRQMIKKAAAKKEVALAMIIKRAKLKACERCVRQALQRRGIRFRRMRSKPLLTTQDVKERYKFAEYYKNKPKSFWRQKVHLYIDIKSFQVYLHAAMRAIAAMREVRGAYREKGQGLDEGYVVVPKHMKQNTGAKSAKIAGGVGKGKVLLWHNIGKSWNSEVASNLYKGPILAALHRTYPRARSYLMLEDNDPTGFKSSAGVRTKNQANIRVLAIPKRSPDLSGMDYAVWKKIVQTMRSQERRFKKSKRESRSDFLARLQRTAKSLPRSFINKAIGNMKERCNRVYEAKGWHIEEGGKSMFVK